MESVKPFGAGMFWFILLVEIIAAALLGFTQMRDSDLLLTRAGGKNSTTATITLQHGYEPASPGLVYIIDGCGYTPGVSVRVIDEVTYIKNPYFDLTWDTSIYWGQREQVEYDAGIADVNGCLVTYWTQSWGIGTHTLHAYQSNKGGKMQEKARSYYDNAPHNDGPAYMTYSCLFYAPTPTPYLGLVPLDGSLPAGAYQCPS